MAKTVIKTSSIFILILTTLVIIAGYLVFKDTTGPNISFNPELRKKVGPKQELTLEISDESGVKSVEIAVVRGSKRLTVLEMPFSDKPSSVKIPFNLEKAELPEGGFILEVKVYDASFAGFGIGNSTTNEINLSLDNKPPYISVKTVPPGIKKGGAALIVYEVNEEVKKTGIYIDEVFFQGYPQKENMYVSLFPFPEYIEIDNYLPKIMAEDLAGNITESRLAINARNINFREDDMQINDKFLTLKKDELARLAPNKNTPLEQYIEANNISRTKDNQIIMIIGSKSMNKPQWTGDFLKLPRSAEMAQFGDRRTYYYNGEVIDNQVHMGIDLASVAKAKVPASNNGKVVFAEPLGIYGKLVIIDHGVGLFSLYSHLTDINVEVGLEVKAGDIVGTTGTTGLAGGDHVHFGFLVGGIAVQPREWLDKRWVQNNINSRLNLVK